SQIAIFLGRTIFNVGWRRRKLGIPCFREHRIWQEHELEMLGVKTDEEVVQLTGHPLGAVEAKRQQLGRPKADPLMDYWTPEEDKLLGTMPDRKVAARLGRSSIAVMKRRLRLGIDYRAAVRPRWPEEALALL